MGAGAAALFVIALVVLVVTRSDGDASLPATDALPAGPAIDVDVGAVEVSTATGRPVSDVAGAAAATDAILSALDRFVTITTTDPVVDGGRVTRLAEVFTPRALKAARGADRPAVATEGLPAAVVAALDTATASIRLLDFGDQVLLGVVHLDVVVASSAVDGPDITVTRRGELVMRPGADGDWKVDGYDLTATRDLDAGLVVQRWLWPFPSEVVR